LQGVEDLVHRGVVFFQSLVQSGVLGKKGRYLLGTLMYDVYLSVQMVNALDECDVLDRVVGTFLMSWSLSCLSSAVRSCTEMNSVCSLE